MKNQKNIVALLAIAFLTSAFFTVTVNAATPFPNLPLPPTSVTLTSVLHQDIFPYPPGGDMWYIDNTLSNVPGGYDVDNGLYTPSWCVDRAGMQMADGDEVYLFSSLDLPLEAEYPLLYLVDWNRVNYILNNIPGEATTADIQQAIWAFVEPPNPGDQPPSSICLDMISDATANGETFAPGSSDVVAVICYPVERDVEDIQITIITLEIPSNGGEGLTPGYWKNHPDVWPSPYITDTLLEVPFDNPGGPIMLDDYTLLDALKFKGGSGVAGAERILLRAAVAALLNSKAVNYPLTTLEVINQVNAALATNNRETILSLASELDYNNNLGV